MNLDHLQATHLVQKLDWTLKDGKHDFGAVKVAVLPPFTDLRSVQTLIDGDRLELKFGAQDLSVHDAGAYTGEISGAFLSAKLRAAPTSRSGTVSVASTTTRTTPWSTRRSRATACRHGIHAIFCCGEGLEIRQAGTHVEHVLAQVEAGLDGLSVEDARSIVVAYEPYIWAIGTGEVATPERAGRLRGDPYQARRALQRRRGGRHRVLRRFGEVEQRGGHHGQGGRRRRPRRRGLDRPGRVRRDLPLPGPPRHGLTSP